METPKAYKIRRTVSCFQECFSSRNVFTIAVNFSDVAINPCNVCDFYAKVVFFTFLW